MEYPDGYLSAQRAYDRMTDSCEDYDPYEDDAPIGECANCGRAILEGDDDHRVRGLKLICGACNDEKDEQ